ncbi:tetratricopeptide repeat protein [Elizabethkingia meningoseptica]|uniref:tetratricopeptide repeat protein n=1 Tax=Elizabethkingia meningoseptica TaxID=238 RepID=UPI000B3527E7|nr:tetratricopeptide repeat protein [Elizabethkingia meningoseptica]
MMKLQPNIKYIFLMLFSLGSFWGTAQSTTSEQQDEAYHLYENKKYADAVKIYETLLKTDYKNTYLLCMCGTSYFNLGKYEKAKEKYSLAILYCPPDDKKNRALYYSNLSACYSNLNNTGKAYENAIKAYHMDNERLWNAASMAQNAGKYEESLNLMNKAAETTELNIAYQTLYGRCYYNTKQYKEAVKSYQHFFDHYNPDDDFVTLDIAAERQTFLFASLYVLGSETDPAKIDAGIAGVQKIMKASGEDSSRKEMVQSFTQAENICSMYSLSPETCTKIFHALVQKTSQEEELKFTYYALQDYKTAYSLSENIRKTNEDREVKMIRYWSALHLFITDYFQNGQKADTQKLDQLVSLFTNLFEKNKTYSDQEFTEQSGAYLPVLRTFNIFNMYFKKKEQIKAVSFLIRIMEKVPNERAKAGIMEILNAGFIEN